MLEREIVDHGADVDRPLIAASARRPAMIAVVCGAAVAFVLAAVVWHGTTTSFDTWAFRRAYFDFPPADSLGRRFWLWFSEPVVSIAIPVVVAVWAVLTKRWNVALLAVVGPSLALGLAELVGKPLVARVLGPEVLRGSTFGALTGSYPSGHETGLVSWLVLVLVVLFRAPAAPSRLRLIGAGVAVIWALLGALGLTVNYYHYATDTIGAMGLTVATMLAVALAIDRLLPSISTRRRAPRAEQRPGQFT